jgi:hypothetical protein
VALDTSGKDYTLADEILEEDVRTPQKPRRIAIRLRDAAPRGEMRMTFEPAQP